MLPKKVARAAGSGAKDITLEQPREALLFADPRDGNIAIDAPLVFVGYGLATAGYDDLDGVDLHGAIALVPCVSQKFYEACDDCPDETICRLKPVFIDVREKTYALFSETTIQSFLDRHGSGQPPKKSR